MTKNSETVLDRCKCGGEAAVDLTEFEWANSESFHVKCLKCGVRTPVGSAKSPISQAKAIKIWNTRAPSDTGNVKAYSDANHHIGVVIGSSEGKTKESAQIVADYILANPPMTPERGGGQGDGKPFPELDQVINHIAPMLSGEKETGIEWGDQPVKDDVYEVIKRAGKDYVLIAEWAVQTYLSRQSAVGGDWEKELDQIAQKIKRKYGMDRPDGFPAVWLVDETIQDVRRALRCATRTPEGEMCCRICIENISTDPNMRICQSCYDEHSAEPGFIEAVSGKTPPPRQTATGGITVEDVRFLLRLMPKWALEDEPGLDPTMYGTLSYEGDKEVIAQVKKIAALIERAGEEDHE